MPLPSISACYWERFPDISFANWKVECGHPFAFYTPSKTKIFIDRISPDLRSLDFSSDVSTLMWVETLGFLTCVDDLKFIETVLDEFIRLQRRPEVELKQSSWDHCAAVRINTMLYLMSRYGGTVISQKASYILNGSMYGVTASTLKPNNHGMMLAFSGIKAVVLGALRGPSSLRVMEVSEAFLRAFFVDTFDDHGWCNENTPGYQDFFRKYVKEMLRFLQAYRDDGDLLSFVSGYHDKIVSALNMVVLPNGNIPPIGESGFYPTAFRSTPGAHCFLSSGLFISKTPTSYLSVISGRRSETHKQMDDTSITVWADGKYLISDSGLYLYSRSDSIARSVGSQRGHSGFFLRRFDGFTRPEFISRYPGYTARMLRLSENGTTVVQCDCSVPEEDLRWSRRIAILGERSVDIQDTTNAQFEDTVQRFVVPNSFDVRFRNSSCVISSSDARLVVSIHGDFEHSIKTGKLGTETIGWMSGGFRQVEAAQVVEIYPEGVSSRLSIEIG